MADKKIEHVAIIMDGNRRWARERNLTAMEGHLKGYEIAKKAPEWFFNRGVKTVSLFSFSTENWKRPQEEVGFLMALLKRAIDEESQNAVEKGNRILISGRINELPGELPQSCVAVMEKTKECANGTTNICVNYGGRAEIVDAVKKIIENKVPVNEITEQMISQHLYFPDLPEPDLIVRTSGEKRTSGFLLWQSAYSEFLFLQKKWPEFEERDVEAILEEYQKRNRRFGGN